MKAFELRLGQAEIFEIYQDILTLSRLFEGLQAQKS
jgi:hypothetical protein